MPVASKRKALKTHFNKQLKLQAEQEKAQIEDKAKELESHEK